LNNIWKEIFAGIFADFTAALEQERGWEFLWQCEKGENTSPTAEGFQRFFRQAFPQNTLATTV